MASSNPFYEMFGGYYPGEPIPRVKPTPGNLPAPRAINPDELISAYMSSVSKELEKFSVSEQAKSYFISDLEKQLVLKLTPQKTAYDPVRSLELGDEEDVAGVQLQIDLAPWKWLEDPEKMVEKTFGQWKKDFLNWSDFSNYYDMNKLWDPLLKGQEVSSLAASAYETPFDDPGAVASYYKPFQLYGLGVTHQSYEIKENDKSPGNFWTKEYTDNSGAKQIHYTEADLNAKDAQSFKSFIRQVRSSGKRNIAFGEHVNNTILATHLDLKEAVLGNVITGADNIREVENFGKKARILRMTHNLMGEGDKTIYQLSDGTSEAGLLVGVKDLKDELSKTSLIGLGRGTDKAKVRFEQIFGTGKLIDTTKPATLDNIERGFLGTLEDELTTTREWLKANKYNVNKEMAALRPVEDYVKKLRKLENTKVTDLRGAIRLNTAIDVLHEQFSRVGPIKGGIDRVNENLSRQLVNGKIGQIIKTSQGMDGTKNKLFVLDEVLRQYRFNDFGDLIDQLESKGLLGVTAELAWNKIRKRLGEMTPAKIAGKQLEKFQYLGLVYNPAVKYNAVTWLIFNASPIAWALKNKQKLSYTIGKDKTKFTFVGNKSLKGGLENFARLKMKDDNHLSPMDFLKMLNGDTVGKLNSKFEGHEDLLKWLLKNNKHIKLTFVNGKLAETQENITKLNGLFGALQKRASNPSYVSIFQDKAGLMQKLSSLFNRAQDTLARFSKFLAPISYIKNVIAKRGAQLASKLLAKLFGAAINAGTGGLATILLPIIEKVVQYTIKKVLDFGGRVLKAIKDADFGAIENFVTWSAETAMKSALILMSCCFIVFLPFVIIFTPLLSSISPVDPTRMAQGLGDAMGGGYATPVACIPCCGLNSDPSTCAEQACTGDPGECEVTSSVGCFQFTGEASIGEEGSWPSQTHFDLVYNAAEHLRNNFGCYVDKLCVGGDIYIAWNDNVLCGYALGNRQIQFGAIQCWGYNETEVSQSLFNNLFAHETGHIFDGYGDYRECVDKAGYLEGRTETYGVDCIDKGQDEDFAETVANYVVGMCDWSGGLGYPEHYKCSQDIFSCSPNVGL